MNEEGSRFAPGMMGSAWFAGQMRLDALWAVRDADGVSVGAALDALHAAFAHLPRHASGFPVAAYVEAHIEQGPLLEAAGFRLQAREPVIDDPAVRGLLALDDHFHLYARA